MIISESNPLANNFKTKEGKSYSYWRLRILYSTIVGYASFYLVRHNLSFALPGICEEFDYSSTKAGLIITLFSLVYGLGKFLNGYLSDNSNARYFMSIGLISSAIISVIVGFNSSIVMLAVLWSINGWFQSMGWPPSARILTRWFSPKELGTKWSIWSCSHQIGNAAIATISAFLIYHYGWRFAFWVPGIIAMFAGFFILNRLRDNPKDVGLPEVEIYKNDVDNIGKHNEVKLTFKETINLVFKNKFVWYISMANIFLYIPRSSILNWGPKFLKDFKGYDIMLAGGQMVAFDIAGIAGAIFAGWVSDKVFKGRRGPVGAIYLVLFSFAILLLWKIPKGLPWLDAFSLILAGFLIAGPQVLAGLALADFASKRAVGVATGFSGLMSYVFGAAVSGLGIGKIVDCWGWDAGFLTFIVCSLIGAFFFALTCKTKKHK